VREFLASSGSAPLPTAVEILMPVDNVEGKRAVTAPPPEVRT
jgi:hypothetical protein